jgi:anaerobic magnesium-protoporphyrin IX monomethyl ester cyclase
MHLRLVGLNCRYTHSCLALYYLRAVLEEKLSGEARVELMERTINDPYYETLLDIAASPVDVLFFSVYIWNEAYVKRLVRDLRQIMPDLPVVVGGPQPSYGGTEHFLKGVTVVRGEAEGLPAVFFEDLAGLKLQPLYEASGGADFPFPYREHDFSATLRNRSVYYEASRGCPFSCTYCLSSIEPGVKVKEPQTVEQELDELLAWQPKTVRFVDRTFNTSPERTLRLWEFLAGKQGETVFHFEIAPDRFNGVMLRFLESVPVGRFRFEIGLQSTNPKTLAEVRRPTDMEKARENILTLMAIDKVHLHLDLILGLPFETEQSFRKSFNDVFALLPHYFQMGLLKILPGTEMERRVADYGMHFCQSPPFELLCSRWMDYDTLSRLYFLGECIEAVCNNRFFRSFLRFLQRHCPDPFAVFSEILVLFQQPEMRRRAKTQELVSSILFLHSRGKPDQRVMKELLRHDWLRSGHRFLPAHLEEDDDRNLQQEIRRRLPQNLEPYYSYRNRDEFIKRSMFLAPSAEVLSELGFPGKDDGCLCFLSEKESTVLALQKTVWLPFD